jgi:hypothetical protein
MLNEMKNYELDWGVIAIYTCERDCDVGGQYVQEFCYKQDIMKGDDEEGDIDMESLKLNMNQEAPPQPQPKPIKPPTKSSNDKKKKPEKKAFAENDDWE